MSQNVPLIIYQKGKRQFIIWYIGLSIEDIIEHTMLKVRFLSLFLLVGLAFAPLSQAQELNPEEGMLKYRVSPKGAMIKLGDRVLSIEDQFSFDSISLSPGQHIFEVWAPRMAIIKDTVVIEAGKVTVYSKGLKRLSDPYRAYVDAKNEHNFKYYSKYAIDGLIFGGSVLGTYLIFRSGTDKIQDFESQAGKLQARYLAALTQDELSIIEAEYRYIQQQHDEALQKRKKTLAVSIPATIGLYVWSYFRIKSWKTRKAPPPEYQEDSPWTRLRFDPIPPVGGLAGIRLTYNLSK
jgi:hypothetical protein